MFIGRDFVAQVRTFIIIQNLQHAMNIGLAFLKAFKASLDFDKNILILGKSIIRMQRPQESPSFSDLAHLDSINTNQGKTTKLELIVRKR